VDCRSTGQRHRVRARRPGDGSPRVRRRSGCSIAQGQHPPQEPAAQSTPITLLLNVDAPVSLVDALTTAAGTPGERLPSALALVCWTAHQVDEQDEDEDEETEDDADRDHAR
jgi:hypothetical protein